MAERKSFSGCSVCETKSEHDSKLKIAQIDRNISKEISLVYKTPDGNGDDPIPISLSDYSESESEDDQNVPLCECFREISNEERELFMLPPEYVVGETVAGGSCFFDSFQQGLRALGLANMTIAELRTICAEVGNKSPGWLVDSLPSGLTVTEFTKRTLLSDSRCDTELHGRILCKHFNVNLYVMEGNADYSVMCRLVTASDVRYVRPVSFDCSDTIYIINRGRNHYEPIISVSPEFKDVHRAINAGDVLRLEAALVNHQRVLYYSRAERQLEQCSLRDAILSYNIGIVDLLYEHWAGAALAAHSPHFHNLQRLGRALVKARDSCLPGLNRDQVMFVDVHCIIEFNKFEVELYQQLNDYPVSKSNDRGQRLLRTIDILTKTIDLHEKYSDKNIRATKNEVFDILRIQPLLNDKSTIYQKLLHYAMYEIYYRKLDFCVSKVILEYVHSLKEKLKLSENAYQNIECALYYFLYRVNEEWRLYMPENRQKGRKHAFLSDTGWDFSYIRDDNCRLVSGPVIYFEWLKFRKSLRDFNEVLQSTSVADNFRSKLPADEVNSLTLLPYLRDDHSLRKVVQYLEGAERAIQRMSRVQAALVIQRALQVTGECLKSTTESLHLSSTTKALLQVYIPASTLKHLHTLRNDFSKIRDGKLIRRINIEETDPDFFIEGAKDLEWIKKAINKVLAVYKPMFEKYLLDEGLHLLMDREKEFPFSLSIHDSDMNEIQKHISYGHRIYTNSEDYVIKIISDSYDVNITRQFARELGALFKNKEILRRELNKRDFQIITNVQTLLRPVYSELRNIEIQINEWTSIRKELEQLQILIPLPEYPNDKLKLVIEEVNSLDSKTRKQIMKKLLSINDYSLEWCNIKTILKYIVVKLDLFRKNHYEIKCSRFTDILNRIDYGQPNATGVAAVKTLLSFINEEVKVNWKTKQTPVPRDLSAIKYETIKRLKDYMSKKKFITNNEMEYLKNTLDQNGISHPIMVKILNQEEITVAEREVMLMSIKSLDNRCKAIVENLVIGSKRNECALQCLAQRAKLLRDTIASKDIPQLVQRYNQDEGFRILTESLLADIYAVHVERNLRDLLDDNMRLLAEFPMRNILDHGNPLLEVIGKILDSNDFPATLFRFALRVVEDVPALIELTLLYEQGVKCEQAQREWSGPHTPRLHHYFKLLPSQSGHSKASQSNDGNKQHNHRKDTKVSDTQVANDQIDEHIYTINHNIPKRNTQDKRKTVKDQRTLIWESGTIYCIQYSKDDEKKVISFMNKIMKKKAESEIFKLKTGQETRANVDENDVVNEINTKEETKSNVRENKRAGTSTGIGFQDITNLSKTESSMDNYTERSYKRLKHNEEMRNKEIDRRRIPQMSNLCILVDESYIQTLNRENSPIKTSKYFLLTYLEMM